MLLSPAFQKEVGPDTASVEANQQSLGTTTAVNDTLTGRAAVQAVLDGIKQRTAARIPGQARASIRRASKPAVGLDVERVAWFRRGGQDSLRRAWTDCCEQCRAAVEAIANDYEEVEQ